MAIYLDYAGIKGNVTASGYQEHIAVLSVKFNVQRLISMESGNLSNREVARPTMTEVTLTKLADNSAAAMFNESVMGSAGKTAHIKFVRTGAEKLQEYINVMLENCLVSHYEINAESDGTPIERIKLSFSQIIVSYTNFDAANKAGTPLRVGYDVALATIL